MTELIELMSLHRIKKYYHVRHGLLGKPRIARSLSDVNFRIFAGKTLSIVGESGSGKSTTTRLILLLEKATEGEIFYQRKNISSFSRKEKAAYRKDVQAVFQDPYSSLDPQMRIRDIIGEPLRLNTKMKPKEIKEQVEELLGMIGLDPAIGMRYPHEFSGGQRQRIAIARALTLKPKLIVLDEPVSSLDVSVRGQILNLFQKIKQQYGISYLFISHDIAIVRYLSDYIAVMYFGKIVEYAPADVIFNNPLHPYTQALLASSVINSIQDKVEDRLLKGEIPSIFDVPANCPFCNRCPYIMEVCKTIPPGESQLAEKDHYVSCHRYFDYII
jgi:oligopeptide/dipeptide ABC transporter ATP-binding protein